MRVVLGADHGGYELKEAIRGHLESQGYEVLDVGTYSTDSVDYPMYGFAVGNAILKGEADLGIAVCGTGQGISIAANKLPGIRSAVCTETFSARMAREHNNANVLALGGRVVGVGLALDIVDIFLKTEFSGGRHERRINLITDFELGKKV
ncbi:ribose-5-phosphate isomerase B [Desulfosporosinus acididurans]|uniref:Ribose-5-phosphate isomerase B n=1 Tax=Desulfosporosinus acididurans TaxID=476652 RepID=A0A0J1FUV2_9FIRM|nr:ribose 5-phosphate isomerase B [Desulfosporosinus acididurans]KLU67067.1 ribose-5-phosphate isomerase B [Desulfosporosinus acididurans]